VDVLVLTEDEENGIAESTGQLIAELSRPEYVMKDYVMLIDD